MKKFKIFCFVTVLTAIAFSCRNETCMEPMTKHINIHFYKYRTIKDSSIYHISAYGNGQSDSLIYDTNLISFIKLPLDENNDQSQFILTMTALINTVTIKDSTPEIDSIILEPQPDTIWKYKYSSHIENIFETYPETLTVSYTRELDLVTPECGFSSIIKLDSIWSTTNIIDSIFIPKATIERGSDEENVKIFL